MTTRSTAGVPLHWWEAEPEAIEKVAAENPGRGSDPIPGPDDVAFLPNEQFAFIAGGEHEKVAGEKRLFPTNSPAATLLNMSLYKAARECFSDPTQETIEFRFKTACDWHGLEVPAFEEEQEKVAAAPGDVQHALVVGMGDGSITRMYAMPSEGYVKKAAAYFEKHAGDLSPEHRRQYASNVVARAGELGVQLEKGASLLAYSTDEFRPEASSIVRMRKAWMDPLSKYATAYEKLASSIDLGQSNLDDAAVSLAYIDKHAGLDQGDDHRAELAMRSKVAASFSADIEGETVTDDMLKKIDQAKLTQYFGRAFAKMFAERPVETFSALSEHEQTTLKELAYGRA